MARESTETLRVPLSRADVGDAEAEAAAAVIRSQWLGPGSEVAAFGVDLATYLGVEPDRVLTTTSCTAALHLALVALNLEPASIVGCPTLTYAATYQAVVQAGHVPLPLDIDRATGNIDESSLQVASQHRASAVIAVHYGGSVHGMGAVRYAAAELGLAVVHDAAHSFGSHWDGDATQPRVGATDDIVCFSFGPQKPLSCGQGGAVCAPPEVVGHLATVANLGLVGGSTMDGYRVVAPGWRYGLSDVAAAIGRAQLRGFAARAQRRREIWDRYRAAVPGAVGVMLWGTAEGTVPYLAPLVVRENRDGLRRFLAARGIESSVHFPLAHRQGVCGSLSDERFPGAVAMVERLLSLPLFATLTDTQVDEVCDALQDYAEVM